MVTPDTPDTGEPPPDEPVGKPSEEEVDPEQGQPPPPPIERKPLPSPLVPPPREEDRRTQMP